MLGEDEPTEIVRFRMNSGLHLTCSFCQTCSCSGENNLPSFSEEPEAMISCGKLRSEAFRQP
jgi:hypothetical protein